MLKYKAKMRYCDEWVCGELVNDNFLNECIDDRVKGKRAINKKTICKNTLVKDQLGKSIFINDIVSKYFGSILRYGVVISKNNKIYINWIRQRNIFGKELEKYSSEIRVYSNIYEDDEIADFVNEDLNRNKLRKSLDIRR